MVTFSSLKKDTNSIERLAKEIEKANSGQTLNEDNDTYWTPTVDKAGNGFAIIRLLPAPPVDGDEALPWVRYWSHSFQGPGGWYIENSLTTLGKPDPLAELNNKLWNEDSDDESPGRRQARVQKRKLTYVSNIYVVSDSKNPETEGKVFKFKYGKKIHDKIQAQLSPEVDERTGEPLDPPVNVFDFWKGANLRLKIKQVAGYRNYDESKFETPGPLLDNDKKMEEIWNSEYSLKELIADDKFKSYDELAARLAKVLGTPKAETEKPKAVAKPRVKVEPEIVDDLPSDEEDPDIAIFKALANDE